MNAEFNWWLLIVGLAIGAGLVWLVLADSTRREVDLEEDELPIEAEWISATLRESGVDLDPETARRVVRLHRAYLAAPPPDGVVRTTEAPTLPDRPPPGVTEPPRPDWSRELPGGEPDSPPRTERRSRARTNAAPPAD